MQGDFHACKTYHLKFGEIEGSLDCQNEIDGKTALAIAAENEDEKLVEFLLNRGADPSIKDRFGCIPLHYAAASFEVDIAERLLLAGCEVRCFHFSVLV